MRELYALGAIVYFEQFADGLSTVALVHVMMDRCRPASPGTDYSLQASLMVMVTGVAATLGGLFTERFGYGAVFAAPRCSPCWPWCRRSCPSARVRLPPPVAG